MVYVKVKVEGIYDDEDLTLNFPDSWDVREVKMVGDDAQPLTDGQIHEAFQHPIGTEPISQLAKGKRGKVVIVIDDWTRPTPVRRVLPHILNELHEGGISRSQILILCGCGTHIPMKFGDFVRKVGWDIVERYDCVNHNLYENLLDLGFTGQGTHLQVNKFFAEADLRIAVCGIKKHRFAGTSGGGKAVLPGVSSIDSTYWNHTMIRESVKGKKSWMIKGNRERMDMQEAGRMANLDVTVNCNYNQKRELVDLHVGDLDEAWVEAVKLGYKLHSSPQPNEKADIVVLNAYPQASHGIDWSGANDSLRKGGAVIAIHHSPHGYHEFFLTTRWSLNPIFREIWPTKPWPVENADRILIYDPHPSVRHMRRYSRRVEWVKDWDEAIKRLSAQYGEDMKVNLYRSKLQFNPKDAPLII